MVVGATSHLPSRPAGADREALASGVGALLRSARIAAGWSQCRLARRAGCNQAAISLLERGLRRPRRSLLEILANQLDPAGEFELLDELVTAAGSYLVEDTPEWLSARRRHVRRAGRRRFRQFKVAKAMDRESLALMMSPCLTPENIPLLYAAERPGASPELVDWALGMYRQAQLEHDRGHMLERRWRAIMRELTERPKPLRVVGAPPLEP